MKALVNRNVPLRLMSSTASQSASLMRMSRPSRVMPALLTRMSTLPAAARICSAAASTLAASATLAAKAQALRPSAWTFCTVSAQNSSLQIHADDVRAGGGEFQGDGLADAAAGAGHDGDLIG